MQTVQKCHIANKHLHHIPALATFEIYKKTGAIYKPFSHGTYGDGKIQSGFSRGMLLSSGMINGLSTATVGSIAYIHIRPIYRTDYTYIF